MPGQPAQFNMDYARHSPQDVEFETMNMSDKTILAKGTWLYDGTVPCRVVIS